MSEQEPEGGAEAVSEQEPEFVVQAGIAEASGDVQPDGSEE